MSIETDIKQQKPFKTPYQKVVVNILYTNNWLSSLQVDISRKYGITPQQYNVLRILRGQYPNPITVNAIIERMLDKMSNASRLVDKLLAKGLVTRQENKDDRRACDIQITKEGLNVLEEMDVLQQQMDESLKTLTEQEANQLSFLLDKLRGSAE